jgi:hypothetical protein
VPPGDSARKAAKALREAGRGHRDVAVRAAQRVRIDRFNTLPNTPKSASRTAGRTPSENGRDAPAGRTPHQTANPLVDDLGRGAGRGGTHPADATGTQCVTRRGTHATSVTGEPSDSPPIPDSDFAF